MTPWAILPLVLAATSPALPALSLGDAVRMAGDHDPEVLTAAAALATARAERQRAGLVVPQNPTLAATYGSDRVYADTGERQISAEVSQELWAPGQRASRIRAADAGVAAADAALRWARRRSAAETAMAYARLSVARRKESALDELLDVLARLDETSAKRAEIGELSAFERNQVLLDTAAARAELARLRGETATAKQDLELRTGLTLDASTRLEDPQPAAWSDVERLAEAAPIDARPDIVAAQRQLERADHLVTVEKRERRPRPTLVVGWQSDRSVLLGDDFTGLPFPTDALTAKDTDRTLSVGVEIAIPIFDRNRAGIASALAGRLGSEIDLARTRREARTDVARLVDLGRVLSEANDALASASGAADQNLAVLQRAFEVGEMNVTDTLRERDRALRSRLAAQDVALAFFETEVRLAAALDGLALLGIHPADAGDDR